MSREEAIARELVERLGGRENILSLDCCMTRLRVLPRDPGLVDQAALKKVSGVKGVVQTGNQIQIILGPGLAQKVADAAASLTGGATAQARQAATPAASTGTSTRDLLRKIAGVFVPLLPAIIGAGMIIALNNVLQRTGVVTPETTVAGYSVVKLLGVLGNTIMGFLAILVGMNAAREWGGPPAIGAVAGAILIAPSLADLEMTPGRGGLIGALIAGAFMGWLYRQISRRMPDAINIIVTPFLTLLVGGLLVLFVFQPIGYYLSNWITAATRGLLNVGGPVAGYVLAALFLPLVMLGIHQGLTPIHLELINQQGVTPLLPILAMAGAGQVGAALAVYVKTRDKDLRQVILAALPVGILGIGEPLIYGVTLPLFRPFIGACIGAGFGGALIAIFKVGALAIGVSGVLLTLLVDRPWIYLLGIVVSYIAGFVATWLLGFDESRVSESQTFTFGD
ncbi:MAG: PTS transporter subunit EIIC [Firmicutes bacterium]|nr:PTS transporter subunit EIIC [Bacillota bacterium]